MIKHLFFVLTFVTIATSGLVAKEPPNILWISADGISRHTLYALLQKKQLPNLQKIIAKGNTRNLDISGSDPQRSYVQFFTGIAPEQAWDGDKEHLKKNSTIFEKIHYRVPQVAITAILSTANIPEAPAQLLNQSYLKSLEITLLTSTSGKQAFSLAKQAVNGTTPFFVFIQYSDASDSVFRYREGTEHYSDTLIAFDKALGELLTATSHHKKPLFVIITSSYGFEKNSRKPSSQSWVISNTVIARKASPSDVVPSILKLYGISASTPPHIGTSFF